MKKIIPLALAALATATTATAQEANLANDFYPYGYFGVNLGSTSVSSEIGLQDFKFITAGLAAGYQFTPIFAVEGLIVVPTTDKRSKFVVLDSGQQVDAGFSAFGVYLNAKSQGDWYFKGRLGLSSSKFSYSADGYEDESNADIGLSYGLGGGYQMGSHAFDLEYITFADVDDPFITGESYSAKTITLSWSFWY